MLQKAWKDSSFFNEVPLVKNVHSLGADVLFGTAKMSLSYEKPADVVTFETHYDLCLCLQP